MNDPFKNFWAPPTDADSGAKRNKSTVSPQIFATDATKNSSVYPQSTARRLSGGCANFEVFPSFRKQREPQFDRTVSEKTLPVNATARSTKSIPTPSFCHNHMKVVATRFRWLELPEPLDVADCWLPACAKKPTTQSFRAMLVPWFVEFRIGELQPM